MTAPRHRPTAPAPARRPASRDGRAPRAELRAAFTTVLDALSPGLGLTLDDARWAALGVDFEMFGKDHQTNAPIYDRICEILGGVAPQHYVYELFLDENGQKISKSKGNGVDPLDVIEKFGADALRFGIAYLTTDTQDVKMPVEFECPHCQATFAQTKKNRILPRIECEKCSKPFSTQWLFGRFSIRPKRT